ncbi:beta-N-acetylhexosaminidase [Hyphomicrobium sp. 1Nfss2.1]
MISCAEPSAGRLFSFVRTALATGLVSRGAANGGARAGSLAIGGLATGDAAASAVRALRSDRTAASVNIVERIIPPPKAGTLTETRLSGQRTAWRRLGRAPALSHGIFFSHSCPKAPSICAPGPSRTMCLAISRAFLRQSRRPPSEAGPNPHS